MWNRNDDIQIGNHHCADRVCTKHAYGTEMSRSVCFRYRNVLFEIETVNNDLSYIQMNICEELSCFSAECSEVIAMLQWHL